MPFLLDILSSKVHVDLLLNLSLLVSLVLFIFDCSFSSLVFSFITETFHGIDFNKTIFVLVFDLFLDILKLFYNLVLQFVSVFGDARDDLSLLFYEPFDSLADLPFNFDLLSQFFDALSLLGFSHAVKSLNAGKFSVDFRLFVIDLEV